jgi:curved DNA-binding protein CbpA
MSRTTLYSLLSVPEDASDVEIKRAYRDAAKAHHPDTNPDAEPGHFARVSEAHEVLSNASRRAAYDRVLALERLPSDRERPDEGFGGFEAYANRAARDASANWDYRGGYGESDMKRRERSAREKAEDAAAAAAWWRREKASSLRAQRRFRRDAARAESRRADRAGEKLKNLWVVRKLGTTRADFAVAMVCGSFVAFAASVFFARRRLPRTRGEAELGTGKGV